MVEGMALVDWFAGQALVGLLAGDRDGEGGVIYGGGDLNRDPKVYAELAYRLAHRMMYEKAEQEGKGEGEGE
jgi:hypothetical protein